MEKIAAIYPAKDGATVHFRLNLPFRKFKQFEVVPYYLPSPTEIEQTNPVEFMNGIPEDLVILHRTNFVVRYLTEQLKQAYGKKIIFDTDDLETSLPTDHPLKSNYPSKVMEDHLETILRNSDEVWVTTKTLKDKISKFGTCPIKVIPNSTDIDEPQWVNSKKENDIFTIGWVGGTSHLPDLPVCVEGFKKLVEEGIDFKLKICGVPKIQQSLFLTTNKILVSKPKEKGELYEDNLKRIFNFIPEDRIEMLEVRSLDNYATFYDDMDIVIAPLADNPFNDSKSELKILEAGYKEIPMVCSNSRTYSEFLMKYPGTILTTTGRSGWYKSLKTLMDNKDLRVKIGKELKRVIIKDYDLDYWAEYRELRIEEILYR